MNKPEYLLTVLSEECAEIQHAVSKALRYGFDEHHPDRETTNEEELKTEIYHFFAMVEMLAEENVLNTFSDYKRTGVIREKKDRVRQYMKLSREIGTLAD